MIDAATLVLVLSGFAPGPLPSASPPASFPSETPLPVPSATAAPSLVPSAPPPSPGAVPVPEPSATADPYGYRFVPRQPAHPVEGVPQIFAVYLNDRKLHSGGPILIKVVTSPDVVKVISRSNGREGVLQAVAPGDFEASSKLPKIPFIAAGMTTLLEFVASNADGKTVSVKVPVTI